MSILFLSTLAQDIHVLLSKLYNTVQSSCPLSINSFVSTFFILFMSCKICSVFITHLFLSGSYFLNIQKRASSRSQELIL